MMDVEMWPVGRLRPAQAVRLRPYPNNPRRNDAGVDAVAASIRAFGFHQPCVVDEQDVIMVGHTRYKATPTWSPAGRRLRPRSGYDRSADA
jgi:site-specific DNA-methyltransferase (adenine-specific)